MGDDSKERGTPLKGFSYYRVYYIDKSFDRSEIHNFNIKVRDFSNISAVLERSIILHVLERRTGMIAPDPSNEKSTRDFIKKVSDYYRIRSTPDTLSELTEKLINPIEFLHRFEKDFKEIVHCEGCLRGLVGLKNHAGGCF